MIFWCFFFVEIYSGNHGDIFFGIVGIWWEFWHLKHQRYLCHFCWFLYVLGDLTTKHGDVGPKHWKWYLPYRINIQKGEPMLFPRKKIYPKKQNRIWPNTLELADHKRALRYQGTKGYQGCKVLWVIWSLLRAAISGLNVEALGSFRAMNRTYVAEIGQQDPSNKCHELHSFQSGHHFSEKKRMIIPWIPWKDNHCWALLHWYGA